MMEENLSDLTKDALAYGVYQKSLEYYRKKWKWIAGLLGTIILILGYMGYNYHDINTNLDNQIKGLQEQIRQYQDNLDSLRTQAEESLNKLKGFDTTASNAIQSLTDTREELKKDMISKFLNDYADFRLLNKQTNNKFDEITKFYTNLQEVESSMLAFLKERDSIDNSFSKRLSQLEVDVDSIHNKKYFPIYLKTNSTTTLTKFDLIVHIEDTKKINGVSESVRGLKITDLNNNVYVDRTEELTRIDYDSVVIESHMIKNCEYKIIIKPIYIFEQFIEHGLVLFQVETIFLSPKERPDICPL